MKQLTIFLLTVFAITSCQSPESKDQERKVSESKKSKEEPQPSITVGHWSDTVHWARMHETIPEHLRRLVKERLPEWRIPEVSDFSKDWSVFYDEPALPYFLECDFDGDDNADYALILVKDYALKVLTIVDSGEGLQHKFLKTFGHDSSTIRTENLSYGLQKQEAGKVVGMDTTVTLTHCAFVINKFESSSRLFYWDATSAEFRPLWTGD